MARNWLIKKTNAGLKEVGPIEEAVETAKKMSGKLAEFARLASSSQSLSPNSTLLAAKGRRVRPIRDEGEM